MNTPIASFVVLLATLSTTVRGQEPDVVFADFEKDDYGDWKTAGTAFGKGPARGTLQGQMPVTGFRGKGLVNSFLGGDGPVGKLTSPEFKIRHRYISFLIGGGGYPGKTCMNLIVEGKVVRTATGPNTEAGGSEQLQPDGWDVTVWKDKSAHIEIVDDATGGWGHINVDHIVFTESKPPLTAVNATRDIKSESRYLFFPVKLGAPKRKVTVAVDGKTVRFFDIELANDKPEWMAPLDVSASKGRTLTVTVDRLPADSQGLKQIDQGDEIPGAADLYRETLRPQLHFSARRGWLNDPNGLAYYNGEYHLFFQHNPYGWNWGNMHWGHAVSKDLLHWQEQGLALYPDAQGPMFSGSAVVDWRNTSGLGKDGKPPLVLLYTAAGNPTLQCLASSVDGRTFTKLPANPILKQITPGNRDPKVIWHEPTRSWVMVLYVEVDKKHTIQFFTSPDLKNWKYQSRVDGFYECPDLFELSVDGDAKKTKWILTGASSEYMVGTFDGKVFTPETPKLPGHRGRGFYAAQTFSDLPKEDGRRIQIGWLQAPSPGMAFNQCMSIPLDLKLVTTADGPRLAWSPVSEFDKLRSKTTRIDSMKLQPGDANPLKEVRGELLDVVAALEPGKTSEVTLRVRGVPIIYDAAKSELVVNGQRTRVPLRNGKLEMRILADRTVFEVFADGGLVYVPMPVIPKTDNRTVELAVKGDPVMVQIIEAHEMRSIWGKDERSSRAPREQGEAKEKWIPLFNGKNLDGWSPKIKGYALGDNHLDTFRVEDGVLKVSYDKYKQFDTKFGHLFYKDKFSHYILRVEYRFVGEQSKGGPNWAIRNSGVMFHCQTPQSMGKDQDFPVSIEAQFLGGLGKGERPTNNVCTPGTNIVMDGKLITRHCTNSKSKTFNGDQWVTAEIEVHGSGKVIHRINGDVVLQYEQCQLDPKDKDAAKLIKGDKLLIEEGYIALQAESHPLEFRKIEIRLLDK